MVQYIAQNKHGCSAAFEVVRPHHTAALPAQCYPGSQRTTHLFSYANQPAAARAGGKQKPSKCKQTVSQRTSVLRCSCSALG
eukprot:358829-Chlamydomonas_euryale.AAC.19